MDEVARKYVSRIENEHKTSEESKRREIIGAHILCDYMAAMQGRHEDVEKLTPEQIKQVGLEYGVEEGEFETVDLMLEASGSKRR